MSIFKIILISIIVQYELIATSDSLIHIHLVKQGWHTGILINLEDLDNDNILKQEYKNYTYIDVGWGDSAFYQDPDFDYLMAFNALFFSPASTLRIEGYENMDNLNKRYEQSVRLDLRKKDFDEVLNFIIQSIYINQNKFILYKTIGDRIKYYKANGKYSAFYTCNTWIADALKRGGMKINTEVIFAEQLFKAVEKIQK